MRKILVFPLLLVYLPLLAADLRLVKKTNRYGEKIIYSYRGRLLVKEERFLKKRRRLRFQIPQSPEFKLVLHFPNGRTISELYRFRVMKIRIKEFTSGLKVLEYYKGRLRFKKEIAYPGGQKQTILYRTKKRKKYELAVFKNGAKTEIWYEYNGKKKLHTNRETHK